MVTYSNVSPEDVRMGDIVEDRHGNKYTVYRDAAYVPENGMVNIVEEGTLKHHDYSPNERLTVSYNEDNWKEDVTTY